MYCHMKATLFSPVNFFFQLMPVLLLNLAFNLGLMIILVSWKPVGWWWWHSTSEIVIIQYGLLVPIFIRCVRLKACVCEYIFSNCEWQTGNSWPWQSPAGCHHGAGSLPTKGNVIKSSSLKMTEEKKAINPFQGTDWNTSNFPTRFFLNKRKSVLKFSKS